ncbi:MAG: asparaginase [Acidobacteriota bacterium]|nr:asparaginase [Acidobacteriota bacterium]
MSDRFELVGRTLRGEEAELWHFGAAAVLTPAGRLVASVGDPEVPTFTRSTLKPIQALPFLLAAGYQEYDLNEADLALICASHAGTPAHTEGVEKLLARGGFGVDDLLCAAHEPYDGKSAEVLRRRGEKPSPLHNNCSGKHAGMLLGCRLLGLDSSGYGDVNHPYQRRVRHEIATLTDCPEGTLAFSIDGCGLPTVRLPLTNLALCLARLADPEAAGLGGERATALRDVGAAMAEVPEMVAGEGRFTTRLIQVTGGRLIGKEGANGLYAVAVRGPVALGVALKLAAGEEEPRDTIVLELLRQLGSLSAGELDEMSAFYSPPVRNHAGLVVGSIQAEVDLIEVPGDRKLGTLDY